MTLYLVGCSLLCCGGHVSLGILRPATPRPRGRPRGSGCRAGATTQLVGTGVPLIPLAASDGTQRLQAKCGGPAGEVPDPIWHDDRADSALYCVDMGGVHSYQSRQPNTDLQ